MKLTVNKADPTVTAPTPNTLEYNGQAQELVTAGTVDGGTMKYAIYRLDEGQALPQAISWTGNLPQKSIRLVSTGKRLKYTIDGDRITVTLPKNMPQESLAVEIN